MKTVCILGGTGFVGSHLVPRLVREGIQVRILSRRPQRHRELRVLPGVRILQADVFDSAQLQQHSAGCDAVINLVAILNQNRSGEFQQVHEELPRLVLDACYANNVPRLLHMSALKSDPTASASEYGKSKGKGELIVMNADKLNVTTFRPSVIFGAGDAFFNRFALFLRLSPCCFPLACGQSKFAPVWVNDVVEVMVRALNDPKTYAQSYDLCGPKVYTLQQLLEFTAHAIGVSRKIISLNDSLSRLQARILGLLPGKPMTFDNYLSMQTDNICNENAFAQFQITPQALENIVPAYLAGRTARGRYDEFRCQAHR
jgi:uncharacterized protein YbjT (DUF2867 family)